MAKAKKARTSRPSRSKTVRTSRRSGHAARAKDPFYQNKYQGWKNWVTWNVALWLGNEEPLYRAARRELAARGKFTAKSAEKFVRQEMPLGTPDMRSSHRGQHGGFKAVDWKEIADSLNEE